MTDLTSKTVRYKQFSEFLHYVAFHGIPYSYSQVGEFWEIFTPPGTWVKYEGRKA